MIPKIPEEACGEKMLRNGLSWGYTIYSPSVQASLKGGAMNERLTCKIDSKNLANMYKKCERRDCYKNV